MYSLSILYIYIYTHTHTLCIVYLYYIYMYVYNTYSQSALRYKPAGRGFHSRWRHWNFSVTSVVNSASNRNEYQVCFLGVKAAGA